MKKTLLKYFSGTGNSFRILNTCKEVLIANGYEASFSSIAEESVFGESLDLAGFCFPVYAFGIPRICRKYLKGLPTVSGKPIKAFVLITAGDADETGHSFTESINLLKKKNFDVVYSNVVQMPSNWTVSMNPPPKDEAQIIIDRGVEKAKKIAGDIINGVSFNHTFNYPARISKAAFYKDYYLFKWLGLNNLWRNFRTDDTCTSCALCSKICPTGSITMVKDKPTWTKTCEQCMRCVNFCPELAIYQKGEGSVKGRNRYHEPGFKPLKIK